MRTVCECTVTVTFRNPFLRYFHHANTIQREIEMNWCVAKSVIERTFWFSDSCQLLLPVVQDYYLFEFRHRWTYVELSMFLRDAKWLPLDSAPLACYAQVYPLPALHKFRGCTAYLDKRKPSPIRKRWQQSVLIFGGSRLAGFVWNSFLKSHIYNLHCTSISGLDKLA